MSTAIGDIPVIDVDAHFTEPPNFWLDRAPAKYKDVAPRVVEIDGGNPVWVVGKDLILSPPGLCVIKPDGKKVYGKFSIERFEDMTPAAHNLQARLGAMDELGLAAQILYPNVLGFAGATVMRIEDVDLRNWCTYAYNDAAHELQQEGNGRIFPQFLMPFWDVDLCVKELKRCHDEFGMTGFNMTETPEQWGLPSLHKDYWSPLWAAAEERGLPCNFHVASGGIQQSVAWEDYTPDRMLATLSSFLFMANGKTMVNLFFSGLLDRFPKLKFVSVESGLGWIPFIIEACEYQMSENMVDQGGLELRPREYFERNIFASYWFEKNDTVAIIEKLGASNVMFETDYPHPTCLYPSVQDHIEASLGGLSEADQRKVLYETAEHVYNIKVPAA